MREEMLELIKELRRNLARNSGELEQLEAKVEDQNAKAMSLEAKAIVMRDLLMMINLDREIDEAAGTPRAREIAELRKMLRDWRVLP